MIIINPSPGKKFHVVTKGNNSEPLNHTEVLNSRETAHENIIANMVLFHGTHVKVEDRSYKGYWLRYTLYADGTITDKKKIMKPGAKKKKFPFTP